MGIGTSPSAAETLIAHLIAAKPLTKAMQIVPFTDRPELTDAVVRFNERTTAGGFPEYHFSERPSSRHFPKEPGREVWMEYFLAVEEPEVRGGYILKYQPFWSLGEPEALTFLKLPVSEGILNPAYASLGIELLQDTERREPRVYALGMGGIKNKLPRILAKMGWDVVEVPFFFKICRGGRFFRNIQALRQTKAKKLACDILGWSGLGSLGVIALSLLGNSVKLKGVTVTEETSFGTWADEIWTNTHAEYHWLGQRNAATLGILYREDDPRYLRMRVKRDGKDIGWVLGLCTDMQDHKQFGNMRVASVVDGLASLKDTATVVAAAVRHLSHKRPDIFVSNQLHESWQQAMLANGFRKGPSNFAQALTPAAATAFKKRAQRREQMHCNRGDGDGPINL